MKRILFFLFTLSAFSSLVMLHSCIKPPDETQNCGDSPDEYYYLSAAQKSIIPYTGYDTISMVSNTGDTIHCIGIGKQYFNTRVFQPHSHPSCAGYGTDKFYEAYKIEFSDSLKNEQIELSSYKYYDKTPYDGLPEVVVNIKGKNYFILIFNISDPSAQNFIGNVTIRGTLYSAVSKVFFSPLDTSNFILINRENGIIKLQLGTNETWELLSK